MMRSATSKAILFTIAAVILYRIIAALPAPGVDYTAVDKCVSLVSGSDLYAIAALMSGGALLKLSLLGLGVIPYITASILVQLLGIIIPKLDALRRDGRGGQATLNQYTRRATVALALMEAGGIWWAASHPGALFSGCSAQLVSTTSPLSAAVFILALVAGAVVCMRIGEMITDRGIGNGMSLMIAVGILSGIPAVVTGMYAAGPAKLALWGAMAFAMLTLVVIVEQGQRRIPLTYSKVVGGTDDRIGTGSRTYLPIKLNPSGVLPIIFASSLLYLPTLLASVAVNRNWQGAWIGWIQSTIAVGQPWWYALYGLLIVFFSFFYLIVTFNAVEIGDDLRRSGAHIPGIRPGLPTVTYLAYVVNRLTSAGALYLVVVASGPALMAMGNSGASSFLGGTSLLIVSTVALDSYRAARTKKAHTQMTGFLSAGHS